MEASCSCTPSSSAIGTLNCLRMRAYLQAMHSRGQAASRAAHEEGGGGQPRSARRGTPTAPLLSRRGAARRGAARRSTHAPTALAASCAAPTERAGSEMPRPSARHSMSMFQP